MRSLLFLLLMLPLPLLAQLQFRYSAGLNTSFMAQRGPIQTSGSFTGYQHGLGVELELSSARMLLLGIESNYSFQGYQQQKAGEEYTYRMHYLNVPVYVSYPLIKELRIEAGGYVGNLLRARFVHGDKKAAVKENYRNTDAGLVAGLSWLSKGRFGAYVRYQSSLRPAVVYPEMAPSGEFIGTLKLLRPQLIMAGVRFYFNNHMIQQ